MTKLKKLELKKNGQKICQKVVNFFFKLVKKLLKSCYKVGKKLVKILKQSEEEDDHDLG
jgi:hypothetical protein